MLLALSYLHLTFILPLAYLYLTFIVPLSCRYLTFILPLYYRYLTVILPLSYLHLTVILPLSYLYLTCIPSLSHLYLIIILSLSRLISPRLISPQADGEWDVSSIPVRSRSKQYACCAQPFSEVTYYLVMHRQYLYYVYHLVMPCAVITAVALLMFCLSPDGGEKIALGLTVLLSLVVFLTIVCDKIPATSGSVAVIRTSSLIDLHM